MLLFLMASALAPETAPRSLSASVSVTRTDAHDFYPGLHRLLDDFDSVPPAQRMAEGKGEVTFRLATDADGKVTACSPIDETSAPGMVARMCKQWRAKPSVMTVYDRPGHRTTTDFEYRAVWLVHAPSSLPAIRTYPSTVPAPPAPPHLAGGSLWRPTWFPRGLSATAGGDLRALASAPPGTVGVYAVVRQDRESPECEVKETSGNSATDAAACAAIKAVRFSYDRLCTGECVHKIPMLVHADGATSRIVFPDQSLVSYARRQSGGPSDKSRSALLKASGGQPVRLTLRMALDTRGKPVECETVSTWTEEMRAAMCAMATRDLRYSSATDVFGRPFGGRVTVPVRIEP